MNKSKHDIAVYAAYVEDESDLLLSTSGGVATALAKYIIIRGGYVAGVTYTEDFRGAEYILTNSISDLQRMRGSKYIETDSNNIILKIKEKLQEAEVLFIGLPCMVAAVKQNCNNSGNLYTCELVCHGPIDSKVQKDYIDELERRYNSRVNSFTVRHKIKKWTPPYIKATFENGQEYLELFSETAYSYAFGILGKNACFDCRFKGDDRKGDLTIGDFWGTTEKDVFYNEKGVSVIFVETEKGMELLKKVNGIKFYRTTFDRAIEKNPMVVRSKTMHPKRERFIKLLEQYDLFTAMKKSMTLTERIKRLIKKMIKR